MENMKEQRMTISEEELEKVAGGTGGIVGATLNFSDYINKAVAALPSSENNPKVGYVHAPIKTGAQAVTHKNYEAGKVDLVLAMNRASECDFTKTAYYLLFALQDLADKGKIVYP